MCAARYTGNDAGRDAALGNLVSLIGFVFPRPIRCNQLSAIDGRIEVEFLGINAEPPFGEQQIAEYDSRALEAVSYVENLGDQLEAIGDVERSRDNSWVVAEGRTQHLPQVTLLGFGGDTSGWPRTLAINHHHRNLCLRREAESLAHQGKPAAGRGAHGTDSCVCRTDGHVDDADLILDLTHHDVCF